MKRLITLEVVLLNSPSTVPFGACYVGNNSSV